MSCPAGGSGLNKGIESPSTDPPHLIVGAGLAGCLLAWRFEQAGQPFRLIGSSERPAAFKVAAGVINPVTGRWMTKSWHIDTLLPQAESTYRGIEAALGIRVYHPIPEIRFCQNSEDLKRVGRRMRNPRYADVLGAHLPPGAAHPAFNDPQGSFEIKQAAYVELPYLVQALRAHFLHRGSFRDETFQHSELVRSGSNWAYGDVTAQSVTFCEGATASKNPFFPELALKPAKGETLLCTCPSLELPETLYHHKKWFLPYSDGSFRIGATYDEADLSDTPTEARAKELLEAAHSALKARHDIHVTAHLAGIRPSSRDSRPLLGAHPTEPGLYLLNGLGSKGASTGPAMSQLLTAHILQGHPIPEEVNLARFG